MDYNYIKGLLKSNLDEYRYKHSLCVADEAERLAEIYGADKEKAYVCGLLHDITKCYSKEEHLKIFGDFDIILTVVEKNSEKLWHAISGAAYVAHVLNVDDTEIISAIRFHTTGKADMSLLEKVLYIADFTSADRTYDDVDIMRKLANSSLDDALLYALDYTIRELLNKQTAVHPDTMYAYNEVVLKKNRGESI